MNWRVWAYLKLPSSVKLFAGLTASSSNSKACSQFTSQALIALDTNSDPWLSKCFFGCSVSAHDIPLNNGHPPTSSAISTHPPCCSPSALPWLDVLQELLPLNVAHAACPQDKEAPNITCCGHPLPSCAYNRVIGFPSVLARILLSSISSMSSAS